MLQVSPAVSQGADEAKAWSRCLGQELPQLVPSWDSRAELGFAADPRAPLSAVWPPRQAGVPVPRTSSVTKPAWQRVDPLPEVVRLESRQLGPLWASGGCLDSLRTGTLNAVPAVRRLKATHCLAEVQHPAFAHWHVIVRLRRASHWLGGATGPVAAQEKAGRGHQQGARGILPEGVEDPSEGELGR